VVDRANRIILPTIAPHLATNVSLAEDTWGKCQCASYQSVSCTPPLRAIMLARCASQAPIRRGHIKHDELLSQCNWERTEAMRAGQNNLWRGKHQSGHNKRRGPDRNIGHNSHNRFYESNGPNVKVRGPASLIAEKYQQLARDAQTSGDLVAAEGYLQHAEHYNRLFAAAQE